MQSIQPEHSPNLQVQQNIQCHNQKSNNQKTKKQQVASIEIQNLQNTKELKFQDAQQIPQDITQQFKYQTPTQLDIQQEIQQNLGGEDEEEGEQDGYEEEQFNNSHFSKKQLQHTISPQKGIGLRKNKSTCNPVNFQSIKGNIAQELQTQQIQKSVQRQQHQPAILRLIKQTQKISQENQDNLQKASRIQEENIKLKQNLSKIEPSKRLQNGINKNKSEKLQHHKQINDEKEEKKFQDVIAKYLKQEELLKTSIQNKQPQHQEQKQQASKTNQSKPNPKKQNNTQTSSAKKNVKSTNRAKSKIALAQKSLQDPNIIDYSKHYKNFNQIFSGYLSSPKTFDSAVIYRQTRNMLSNFVALMDSSSLFFNKHQFALSPLQLAAQNNFSIPNHFLMVQKNFHDRQLEMKNQDNQLMMIAIQQVQLKQRLKVLKQQGSNENPQALIKQISTSVNKQQSQLLINPNREPTLYFRVIKNKAEVYEIIKLAFHRKKWWNQLPHGVDMRHSWNLLWSWSKSKMDHNKLLSWQKINHFQQTKNVSRKDYLKKHLQRVQRMGKTCAQVFNIMSPTYVLPKEYINFVDQYTRNSQVQKEYNYWIMKPCAKSRGRGISLINDITSVSYAEPVIVQKYIKNPLLLNGFKFDLRIYVVVTSLNPLQVFVYKQGFARFSTKPYSIAPEDIFDKFIHLTNSSIQKNNHGSELDQNDLAYGGTKIDLTTLKQRLIARQINWDKIWHQICQIIVKSLAACQQDMPYNPSCFELFGYDVMIDNQQKCWLIQINSSPSLGRMNLLDDMVKQRLIDDIIDLIGCVDFDRKRLIQVLERRIQQQGKASGPTPGGTKAMNRDLTYILNGQLPRRYGELPALMGNFQRIAPTSFSEKIIRLIGGQKMFGSTSKIQAGSLGGVGGVGVDS